LNDITKSFDGEDIFNDVDFEVKTGERIGIVGRNGAGKSTLMKIIAGVEDCDSGHVDRKSTRLNSSHVSISYAVFCVKKKNQNKNNVRYGNRWNHKKKDKDIELYPPDKPIVFIIAKSVHHHS